MASDPRVALALDALRAPQAAFRSYVAAGLDRAAAALVSNAGDRSRLELGEFARGRVNADGFAALVARSALDTAARDRIAGAVAVLRSLASAGDDVFVANVPPGGDLHRVVALAFATLGCAFGALHAVDAARAGSTNGAKPPRALDLWPLESWSKSERQVAPPLVVEVDGADLNVGGLAEFLDGSARIVLVVRGACTPAPLARLVTPGTFVLQTERDGLGNVATASGPAIAALVDGDAALFAHDPQRGRAAWQRMSLTRAAAEPKRAVGRWSIRQQRDELRHLLALAEAPAIPDLTIGAALGAGGGDPAERLATWLVQQAQLDTGAGS